MKRKDLAERSKLSYPYVSELEKGTKEPSARAFRQLAEALELSPTELLALSERYAGAPSGSPMLRQVLAGATSALARTEASIPSKVAERSGQRPETPEEQGALAELVATIVRRELEAFARDVLPRLVATELRRTLTLGVERDAQS